MKKKEKPIKVNVKYSFYANGIATTWRKEESVVEFFQTPEKIDKTVDGIRVYLSPENLKVFINLLQGEIKKYEKQFGKIEIGKDWIEEPY